MMKAILTVDIGSSSVRCCAFRLDANSGVSLIDKCSASRKIGSVRPNTGKVRLLVDDNGMTLLDYVDACVDETLQALRKNHNIEYEGFEVLGVGFSSFVMNLMAVDKQGKPLGEEASISYACNTAEVTQQCRQLRSELGPDKLRALYSKTGAPLHSAYALPQLREFYESQAGISLDIFQWQTIASVCLSRWMGVKSLPISYSEASWTGLLNVQTCEYETTALGLLPSRCRESLPALADYSDSLDRLLDMPEFVDEDSVSRRNPYWDRWPELQKSRFCLGLGDGACANIGSKCSTASRIAVTIGTSAAARVVIPASPDIQVPAGLFVYRIDRRHILMGGALTDGGSAIEWMSNLLNLRSPTALEECMARVQELVEADYTSAYASPSLTMVPFLSGERSTGFRDGAKGALLGLTRETSPAHLLRSCLEGVTLRINAILRLIPRLGKDTCQIVASGKALEENSAWRQLLADCSGLPVVLDAGTQEGTSRGVAILVAHCLSRESLDDSVLANEELSNTLLAEPRLQGKNYWERASGLQEDLIDSLTPFFAVA